MSWAGMQFFLLLFSMVRLDGLSGYLWSWSNVKETLTAFSKLQLPKTTDGIKPVYEINDMRIGLLIYLFFYFVLNVFFNYEYCFEKIASVS